MNFIIEFFQNLLDPEKLIYTGGLILIVLVVLLENGFFFAFFLPGDTLLFTAGLLCATQKDKLPGILTLLISLSLAAIIGSLIGYVFGKTMGDTFLRKKDTLLFKKKYISTAEAFFNKHGGFALVMGRFLPIIRTFAPIFAGIVHLEFKKFLIFNILGGILWVGSLLFLGYFFGIVFPGIGDHLEYIILGIVVITWIPVIRTYLKERKNVLKNAKTK